eukprot:3940981-Rhodomonas_salina.4
MPRTTYLLRSRYALCGTELGHAATRTGQGVQQHLGVGGPGRCELLHPKIKHKKPHFQRCPVLRQRMRSVLCGVRYWHSACCLYGTGIA